MRESGAPFRLWRRVPGPACGVGRLPSHTMQRRTPTAHELTSGWRSPAPRLAVRLSLIALPALILFASGAPTLAQLDPLGAEFQVNDGTLGDQRVSRVAVGPDGSFVLVWHGSSSSLDPFRSIQAPVLRRPCRTVRRQARSEHLHHLVPDPPRGISCTRASPRAPAVGSSSPGTVTDRAATTPRAGRRSHLESPPPSVPAYAGQGVAELQAERLPDSKPSQKRKHLEPSRITTDPA